MMLEINNCYPGGVFASCSSLRKLLSVLLYSTFFCVLATLNALASTATPCGEKTGDVTSGSSANCWQCGDNCIARLDSAGKMTISGEGNMKNYSVSWEGGFSTTAPWYSSKENITSVEITDGITKIGLGAFSGLNKLENATIAKSVTVLETHAFYNSGLNKINYEEDSQLTTIGDDTFRFSKLQNVIIPTSVTNIVHAAANDNIQRKFYCTQAQIEDAGCTAANLGISESNIVHYEREGNHFNVYDVEGKLISQYKNLSDFGTDRTYQRRTSYTPGEAAKHIHKGNDNKIIFTFK